MLDAFGENGLNPVFLVRISISPFDTFYILAVCLPKRLILVKG